VELGHLPLERRIEILFERFDPALGAANKQRLAQEICIALTVRAMIEEEILYLACKGKVDDDLLDEGLVEHGDAGF
jgi:hypothetical protein